MAESDDLVLYHGNCHCGKFRFELKVPAVTKGTECTCRHCSKKGFRWLSPPGGAYHVTRDEGSIAEYDSGVLKNQFCNNCSCGVTGTHSSGPLQDQFLVNINLIMELDPFKIEPVVVQTPEQPRHLPPLSPPAEGEEPAKYCASCTCGKVRIELLLSIHDKELTPDNCSSCSRLAYIGAYPTKQQIRVHGEENTYEYFHGKKYGGLAVCKTCGVHMYSNMYGPHISVFDKLPPERRAIVLENYHSNRNLKPMSIRTIDDLDLSTLNIKWDDMGSDGYTLDP